jgi:tRNA dimethylallyltransferase
MTELKLETKGLGGRFRIKMFGLNMPREKIYEAINQRTERMFEKGLVAEVKRLAGRRLSKTARMALGYKEVLGFIKGEYGIDEAKDILKMNTRRFAKRQLAWFRAWGRRVKWFDPGKTTDERIVQAIKGKVC